MRSLKRNVSYLLTIALFLPAAMWAQEKPKRPSSPRPAVRPQRPAPRPAVRPSTRPSNPRPSARPSTRPSTRPAVRPSVRPSTRRPAVRPRPSVRPSTRPDSRRPSVRPNFARPRPSDGQSPTRISPRPNNNSSVSVRPNRSSNFVFRPADDGQRAEIRDMPILRPSPDGGRRPVVDPSLPIGLPPPSAGPDDGMPTGNAPPTAGSGGGRHGHAPDIFWIHFFDPSTGFFYRYPVYAFGYNWFAFDRLNYFINFYSPFGYSYFGRYYISRCANFISGLAPYNRTNRYGYMADAALARYALGDSVLDQDVVNLAVAEADQLTASLVAQVSHLQDVLVRYEAGKMPRDQFRREFKKGLNFIAETAKQVAEDENLGYIEQREDLDVDDFDKARDIKAFRLLLAHLEIKVNQLQGRLDEMRNRQDFRAISVEEYQEASASELALEVRKVAKALKKSYKKI